MKKLFLLSFAILLSLITVSAQSESIDYLVKRVKKNNRDSEKHDLSIPGWLIRLGANFIDEDEMDGIDVRLLGKKISHLRVVTIENKNSVAPSDMATFFKDIKNEGFEDLMMVRSEGNDVRFMIREKKELIRDIVLLVNERDKGGDFVLLNIEGKFTMDDINRLVKDVKIGSNNKKQKTKDVRVNVED